MSISLRTTVPLADPFPNSAINALACSLVNLDLSFNNLMGSVSPELGPLNAMSVMDLSYNSEAVRNGCLGWQCKMSV